MAAESTRQGLTSVLSVVLVSVLVVAVLWIIARAAPSAGSDPNQPPPAGVPARIEEAPEAIATPEVQPTP